MARVILTLMAALLFGCAGPAQKAIKALDEKGRADQAYLAGDCDKAVRLYRSMLDKYDDMREPWLRVGNCLARQKDLAGAERAYRRVLILDPDNAKAWFNLILIQAQGLAVSVIEMKQNVPAGDPVREKVDALLGATLSPASKTVAKGVQQARQEEAARKVKQDADSREAYKSVEKSVLIGDRQRIKNLHIVEFTQSGRVIAFTASNKEVVLEDGERIIVRGVGYDTVTAVLPEQDVVLIGETFFIDRIRDSRKVTPSGGSEAAGDGKS